MKRRDLFKAAAAIPAAPAAAAPLLEVSSFVGVNPRTIMRSVSFRHQSYIFHEPISYPILQEPQKSDWKKIAQVSSLFFYDDEMNPMLPPGHA
jgi:hypothetical protein